MTEAYSWAIANSDKVSCILRRKPRAALHDVEERSRSTTWPRWPRPASLILHVTAAVWIPCSQVTHAKQRSATNRLGASMTVIVQEGKGAFHYPTSAPADPKPVVNFILAAQEPSKG